MVRKTVPMYDGQITWPYICKSKNWIYAFLLIQALQQELSNGFLLSPPDGIRSLTPSDSIFLNYLPFNIKSGKGKKYDFREIPTDLLLLRMFSNTQKIRILLQIVLEISIFRKCTKWFVKMIYHSNSKPRTFQVIEYGMKGEISHWFYFSWCLEGNQINTLSTK